MNIRQLLTGDEAIAHAALDAGVAYASAYPGTPSTEILETLADFPGQIYAEWAPNEKVALEGAIGASYAGARALASMKHVGLNVAADPLFTNAYTGVNAGLVVITADEPGMHSSQNEQDNRHYAYHAAIPMLEPANSQECYDMILTAYEISESFNIPVLIRVTTRTCHAKSFVSRREPQPRAFRAPISNPMKYVTVPAVSRRLREESLEKLKKLSVYSNSSTFNYAVQQEGERLGLGVVASGIAFEYAREVFGDSADYFKVGFSYPMPLERLAEFASGLDRVLVIEENEPIMETQMKAAGIVVSGKDVFPTSGELLPEVIRKAWFGETLASAKSYDDLPKRGPGLCAGCPHRGFFMEAGRRSEFLIFGDIGCYTLGFSPPFNGMHAVTCMGSSISSAHGAQKVFDMNGNPKRALAVIGDSTFFHTGVNSLLNVAYNRSKVITVILDNRVTGMTGHQDNPGTGVTALREQNPPVSIEAVVRAFGIGDIREINPNSLDEVSRALTWASSLDGPAVIIARWPCALKRLSEADKAEFGDPFAVRYTVDEESCVGCGTCLEAGCPAIRLDKKTAKASISSSCAGCSVCAQVCPTGSITKVVS